MTLLWIAGGIIYLAASATAALTSIAIEDEVEEQLGLPIEERPSWKLFQGRGTYWTSLQIHRKMYPRSWLRRWHRISLAVALAFLIAALAVGFGASGR